MRQFIVIWAMKNTMKANVKVFNDYLQIKEHFELGAWLGETAHHEVSLKGEFTLENNEVILYLMKEGVWSDPKETKI